MSHPDREPAGIAVLKVIGAICLVVLALGFGAAGACGVLVTGSGIWDALRSGRGSGPEWTGGITLLAILFAVVGLVLSGALFWAAAAMFRKRRERDE
jgi:hypothetical protein